MSADNRHETGRDRGRFVKLVLIACGLLSAGCQSATRHHLAAISRFESGDATAALKCLDEAENARGAEPDIIAIDRAIVSLMNGNAAASTALLKQAGQRLDYLRQKDLTEQTRSVLSDDKAISWSGREFEQRMIDNLLVLAALSESDDDAFAWSTQVMTRVNDDRRQLDAESDEPEAGVAGHSNSAPPTSRVPAARFGANALSAYLAAAVHSERSLDRDLTDRAIQQVTYWSKAASAADGHNESKLTSARFGTLTERRHGTLHVITFVGRVTDWTAETAAPTSAALLIADRILSAVGDHSLPPTVAPVRVARPRAQRSTNPLFATVRLGAPDNERLDPVKSRTIVDLNAAAWDSYQHDRDRQIARAVARRIVKKSAVYAAKDQLSVNSDTGLDLVLNLGGIAWEAMEQPDTRHVTLLPERIDAAQLELAEGRHVVHIETSFRPTGQPVSSSGSSPVTVDIEDGRNTYVLCFVTGQQLHVVTPGSS